MKSDLHMIPLEYLALTFVPVVLVFVVLWRWQMEVRTSVVAIVRMLVQLLLIGYVLTYIFEAHHAGVVVGVLAVMLVAASWISLRTVSIPRLQLIRKSFVAILVGGGAVLALMTQIVLRLEPWFLPSYLIPLAGMTFANSMNVVSLAGERLESEIGNGHSYEEARAKALKGALIPITNSLLAVGLVSLPGMMTGQILSGVSPLIAARYQIMIMCMMFSSAGLASALFLYLVREDFDPDRHH
jgi:putative ABC transport system permease protein